MDTLIKDLRVMSTTFGHFIENNQLLQEQKIGIPESWVETASRIMREAALQLQEKQESIERLNRNHHTPVIDYDWSRDDERHGYSDISLSIEMQPGFCDNL